MRFPVAESCRRLWVAVLEQAIDDLERGYVYAGRAQAWFESDNEGVGSFLWICRMLNIDPDYARKGVSRKSTVTVLRRLEDSRTGDEIKSNASR
jgi:hypothetical protein